MHSRAAQTTEKPGFEALQQKSYTLHGFCRRVLQHHAFETGTRFDLELLTDDGPLCTEFRLDFWTNAMAHADEAFVAYLEQKRLTPDTLARLVELAVRYPDLAVLPQTTPVLASCDGAMFGTTLAQVQGLWSAEQHTIHRVLLDFDGFMKYYEHPKLTAWLEATALYLHTADPQAPWVDESVRRLTSQAIAKNVLKKYRDRTPQHPFFDACQTLWDTATALEARYATCWLALQRHLVDTARAELGRRKAAAGVQSFDDLLQQLDHALRGVRGPQLASLLRGQFKAALIVEFQDTDPIQFRIFRQLYTETNLPLFLVGDPKQSIYAYRGADIFAYRAAVEAAHEQPCMLQTNWRSDKALVQAVNYLFASLEAPFVFDFIPYHPVTERPDATTALTSPRGPEAPFHIRFVLRDPTTPPGCSHARGLTRAAYPQRALDRCQCLRDGGDHRAL